MRTNSIVICFITLALLVPAMGAAEKDQERPKIGLALAGGGAKGVAHVGVLQVLEELNVPIDYIGGTSMGAIIAGLYASGLSPDEMEEVLLEIDWIDTLEDQTQRKDLAFRRKEEQRRYAMNLQLGIKKSGIVWPTGLKTGQKLYFMLQSLTLPVADVEDFDRLPTPFRAVATDIHTGEAVVLGHGNLATAMRASMAIPTVFTPVSLDGRLLVDGGLSNNVPVDVVREMGADIVIAVDVGAPLTDRQVESMIQVYQQTMRFLTRRNMEPQLAAADLVITPPGVAQYGTLQFGASKKILQTGVEGAWENEEALRELAVSPEEYQRHTEARAVGPLPTGTIDYIDIEGNRRVDERIIRNKIRQQPGDPLDLDALEKDIRLVFGLGDFKQVSYWLAEEGDNYGLVIQTEEKPWGPSYLHFGLELSSDLSGEFDASILINMTGELRTDLLLGRRRGILSELYQPLDFKGRWFIAPRLLWDARPRRLFQDLRAVAEFDIGTFSGAVDLGYQFGKYGEARIGLVRGRSDVKLKTGTIPPDATDEVGDFDIGALETRIIIDRLDHPFFPRQGYFFRGESFYSRESLGADNDYHRVEGDLASWWTWNRRNTIFASVQGGWSPGEELPVYDLFAIGGFFSLSGFEEEQIQGQYFGVGRLGYYRELGSKKYLGGWFEAGNAWSDRDEVDLDDLIYTATAFVGMDTTIGPVYLAYGYADTGNGKVYLFIGRTF
ncbi:MAG: patatin [Acidobacteria bacterium]|nr:MAG: patatin [Acidobacteriota bacterium]